MKKVILGSIALFSVIALTACGSDDKNSSKEEKTAVSSEQTTKSTKVYDKKPADKDFSKAVEVGKGTVNLSSASGSTAEGQEVIVYDDGNTSVMQIGYDSADFDGSLLTKIYIDGEEVAQEQLGEMNQGALGLSAENGNLKVGKHQVVFAQYPDNDDSQEPVTVKIQEYEVKAK